jgi:release factor glutamine methyltransferase
VLIPRPETEFVVEAALDLPAGARVVDVGTGSGAIALALKAERPDLEVVGTEVRATALDVARSNARRLGLEVELVHGDLLEPVRGSVDAVVSNPPYVATSDPLPPDVVRYEPHEALYAGDDGLDVIRRLLVAAREVPFVALEVGAGQASAVGELLGAGGYTRIDVMNDLAGIPRVVVGRLDAA